MEHFKKKTNTTCLIPIVNDMLDDQFTDKNSNLVLVRERNMETEEIEEPIPENEEILEVPIDRNSRIEHLKSIIYIDFQKTLNVDCKKLPISTLQDILRRTGHIINGLCTKPH